VIGTLLRLPIFAFIGIILAWGLSLAIAAPSDGVKQRMLGDLEPAFPSALERRHLVEAAHGRAKTLQDHLAKIMGPRGGDARDSITVSAVHFGILLRILPIFSALFLVGIVGGMAWRERIRYSRGYASPSAAFIARHAVGLSVIWILVFSFSPIPLPIWSIYGALAASSSGGFLYVSNLPIRL